MNPAELFEHYLDGPDALRRAVEGLSADELDATPIPGKWSVREAVCHIADSEILYADRIKRILAEHKPPLLNADPESFRTAMASAERQLTDEIQLVGAIRTHMAPILKALRPEHFLRVGIHSVHGPLTLRDVLQKAVDHLPHHVRFIDEKRIAIVAGRGTC